MDKDRFIGTIEFDDKQLLGKLFDLYNISIINDIDVCSDYFFPPQVWKKLEKTKTLCNIVSNGIFTESERRLIAFVPKFMKEMDFPIALLKITPLSDVKTVEHRHFLAALLGLGYKREKFGDLILKNGVCYAVTRLTVADAVKNTLTHVNKIKCNIEVLEENFENIEYEFKKIESSVSSFRVDAVISAVFNLSRNKAVELIKHHFVKKNYLMVNNKDATVNDGDIVTVRKYGKFKIEIEDKETRKGKKVITVYQFV